MKEVTIYTDGACSGNPGPGGWGALLIFGPHRREISGAVADTTNNRMELQAAIEALKVLKEPCRVKLHTDSAYLAKAFNEGWLANWQRRGWKTAAKKPVKNKDLWQRLDKAREKHQIDWHWIKGHSGHEGNERADQLANRAMDERKGNM